MNIQKIKSMLDESLIFLEPENQEFKERLWQEIIKPSKEELEMINNLLVTAIEGGSNYWYYIEEHNAHEIEECEFVSELLSYPNSWMRVSDIEGSFTNNLVTHEDVIGAWHRFKTEDKYKHHYADVLAENDDAITGDVFFQLAVIDDDIFG